MFFSRENPWHMVTKQFQEALNKEDPVLLRTILEKNPDYPYLAKQLRDSADIPLPSNDNAQKEAPTPFPEKQFLFGLTDIILEFWKPSVHQYNNQVHFLYSILQHKEFAFAKKAIEKVYGHRAMKIQCQLIQEAISDEDIEQLRFFLDKEVPVNEYYDFFDAYLKLENSNEEIITQLMTWYVENNKEPSKLVSELFLLISHRDKPEALIPFLALNEARESLETYLAEHCNSSYIHEFIDRNASWFAKNVEIKERFERLADICPDAAPTFTLG